MLASVSTPTNAFHVTVPSIASLLGNKDIRENVERTLTGVLRYIGLPETEATQAVEFIVAKGMECKANSTAYESSVHQYLQELGVLALIPGRLQGRSQLIFEQIRDYLRAGDAVVDIGCGDATVAQAVAQAGCIVSVCDVYKHPRIDSTGLPFKLLSQGKALPFANESFDVALLLTVLHHSNDPMLLVAESSRILKENGQLLVIESVYGIDPSNVRGNNDETMKFAKLSHETQRALNIFFDHFYNRVIHYSADPASKINVPFNFNTPQSWNALFSCAGFKESITISLGIDQPVAPEYHTLHCFRKKPAIAALRMSG